MKFAIMLEKTAEEAEFRKVIADHVAYLNTLNDRGVLIAGGPFSDGKGGMILIEAADVQAARAIAEEDPFISRGVEKYTLRQWEVLTDVKPELLVRDG